MDDLRFWYLSLIARYLKKKGEALKSSLLLLLLLLEKQFFFCFCLKNSFAFAFASSKSKVLYKQTQKQTDFQGSPIIFYTCLPIKHKYKNDNHPSESRLAIYWRWGWQHMVSTTVDSVVGGARLPHHVDSVYSHTERKYFIRSPFCTPRKI